MPAVSLSTLFFYISIHFSRETQIAISGSMIYIFSVFKIFQIIHIT